MCSSQNLFSSVGVQSLILQGRISEAIIFVQSTYKGLLENNLELQFRLKCRQFVEMIGGYDRVQITFVPNNGSSCCSRLHLQNQPADLSSTVLNVNVVEQNIVTGIKPKVRPVT